MSLFNGVLMQVLIKNFMENVMEKFAPHMVTKSGLAWFSIVYPTCFDKLRNLRSVPVISYRLPVFHI